MNQEANFPPLKITLHSTGEVLEYLGEDKVRKLYNYQYTTSVTKPYGMVCPLEKTHLEKLINYNYFYEKIKQQGRI